MKKKVRVLDESFILGPAVDLAKLVRSNPELFDFSKIRQDHKLQLMEDDPAYFTDVFIHPQMPLDDRVYFYLTGSKNIREKCKIANDDIPKIKDSEYMLLLKNDFAKFISVEKYKKLRRFNQQVIFTERPEWVIEHIDTPMRITSAMLREFSYSNPEFIDTHVTDFSKLSTDYMFWKNMFSYSRKYEKIFLSHTKTLATKTEVRRVFNDHPRLIKKFTADMLADSKLTCKEWVLLFNSIISRDKRGVFTGWQFPDDLVDMFKLDLMAEVLNGTSKLSKRFQTSIKILDKNSAPEEDINEIEIVE